MISADQSDHGPGEVETPSPPARRRLAWLRIAIVGSAIASLVIISNLAFADPKLSRSAIVAGSCLILWLSAAIPLYATTLLLWAGIVLLLGPIDSKAFSLSGVLSAAANPVMALFFGGFALSAAGSRYGIDAYIAGWMVRASRGSRRALLFWAMAGTAVLSMWMSNIAAGAMIIATLRPLLAAGHEPAGFYRALLLGVALAADFGGIATPIGTGPNLIAMGAVAHRHPMTFLDWMKFGVPLMAIMVALSFLLLSGFHQVSGQLRTAPQAQRALGGKGWWVVGIFFTCVAAWLLEPVHHIPAGVVGLLAAGVLFGSGLLRAEDLRKIEWETLLLVAGGLTLGQLFEDSGLASAMAGAVRWNALGSTLLIFCLVSACAGLSAVASNTAAAAMMIELAVGVAPGSPAVAILVALGASMGVCFVISTPPNSMAYGQGGLRSHDFLLTGGILMLLGCALLATLGPTALRWAGVP